jgi:hypothetical protein
MRSPAVSPPRWTATTILAGVIIGLAGFSAGRLSVAPNTKADAVGTLASATPIEKPTASSRTGMVSVAEDATGSTAPAPRWSELRWRTRLGEPGTPARNAALAEMLEALAATDPAHAMALAQGEANLILRDQLVQAALHGWARAAPISATNWALALLHPAARDAALSAVFSGAVSVNPNEAVRLVRSLVLQNPGGAIDYGNRMIDTLCDAGHFELAAKMAASGDDGQRSFWLGEAYSKWAALQPQPAAQAAAALEDSGLKNLALHGVVGGWSQANPGSAVQFILQLPAGPENGSLLSQALERWTKVDLKAASDWIDDHEAGAAMDAGVSSVATKEYLPPDVAVGWAESVVNPKLRSETLVTVLRNWATVDLSAAKRYFDASQNLLPEDRKEIAGLIATLSGPRSGE